MSTDNLSTPSIETKKRRQISIVWLVPLIAALIGGLVAYQSLTSLGPLVEIEFEEGHGIKAGKTEIKHKNVVVGMVEDVTLGKDLETILVKARMDKALEDYLGDTAEFWVVKATVSGAGLTGLGTIISGVYIEVDWTGPRQKRMRSFKGLDQQPLTPPGTPGKHVTLRTPQAGSLDVGSPVYFRQVRVGQVESRRLADDFSHVLYEAFVEAPYDQLVSGNTHFWNVSGVSAQAGTDGLTINIESLASLFAGGVAFGEFGTSLSERPLKEDTVFFVHEDRDAAEESIFDADDQDGYLFFALFEDSVRGLEKGAPIEWQGIRIGRVKDLILDLGDNPRDHGYIRVVLELQPARVGITDVRDEDVQIAISEWIRAGMRPQLASGNLLSGRKYVEFVEGAGEIGGVIDFTTTPYPTLPTAASNLGTVTQNVEQIVSNLADLPLDRLILGAISVVENVDTLVGDPNTKSIPAELNQALSAFRGAAKNIDAASGDLPQLVDNLNQLATIGESTLGGLSPNSELYVDLSGAVSDLREAARSLSA
ncbi:MAG: MlaD family protein, partial [Pseudomonadota bacterium]